jgi:hypothetical protein
MEHSKENAIAFSQTIMHEDARNPEIFAFSGASNGE